MVFNYFKTVTALDSISIDDIGNTCISAINDDAEEWILVIYTREGWTEIKEFGPLEIDSDDIKTFFNYNKYAHEYNEKKIKSAIDRFINNPKRMITQAQEVDIEYVKERLNIVKNKI